MRSEHKKNGFPVHFNSQIHTINIGSPAFYADKEFVWRGKWEVIQEFSKKLS